MKTIKHGSPAHRAHMSEVMKASWAKRRNRIAARESLLKNIRTANTSKPVATPVTPVKRFVAFNYCPNCGTHLARLYPYEYAKPL